MSTVKRSGSSKSRKKSSRKPSKKSTTKVRSWTILRGSGFDPKKKLSSQGKTVSTTKLGPSVAARHALKRRDRPSRMYLFRDRKIRVYSIKYLTKDGKVKAKAKYERSISQKKKKKKPSSTKTSSTATTTKKKRKKKKRKVSKKKCTCAVKGGCKKTGSKPVFKMSAGKLHVTVNGRRSLVTKSEKDKLKKQLGLLGARRRSV